MVFVVEVHDGSATQRVARSQVGDRTAALPLALLLVDSAIAVVEQRFESVPVGGGEATLHRHVVGRAAAGLLVLPVPLALVVVEAGSAILGRQFLQMGIVDDGVAGAAGQTDGRRGAGVERQPAGIGIGNDRWAGRVSRGDDATLDDADRTRRTGTPRPGTSTLCAARLVTMQRVPATTNAKISHRGQTSLPADLRHRWGLDDGGDIGFIDLGEAALIVPGGTGPARAELRRVLADRYDNGLSTISDPDLADQPA